MTRSTNLIAIRFLCVILPFNGIIAQTGDLRDTLVKISADAKGKVGISILPVESGKPLSVNGSLHLPMQSAYKFPLAVAVLDQVDKGKLSLDQKIHVSGTDWARDTYSPMRDKYQAQEADIPLSEMISFTVSMSDNNGCDLLFSLLGGCKKVNDYIHSLGISDMSIVATEAEMHADEQHVQYQNWGTTDAFASLLKLLYSGKCLSRASTSYLLQLLEATTTGPHRLKGLLDSGTVVAHKTGSGYTNAQGSTSATNDAGIITLPNGHHLIVVVFVSDAMADEPTRDGVIARIAKAAFLRAIRCDHAVEEMKKGNL